MQIQRKTRSDCWPSRNCSEGSAYDRKKVSHFIPYVKNGLSHPDHLGESTFIFRGIRCNFSFFFSFFNVIKQLNWRCAASHLGLFCLPMSHKKDTRVILVQLSKLKPCFGHCTKKRLWIKVFNKIYVNFKPV